MSIVRNGEYGSDVYIIGSNAGWECVGCDKEGSLQPWDDEKNLTVNDLTPFFIHLQNHRDAGDCVPSWVEDKIRNWNNPDWVNDKSRPWNSSEVAKNNA